MFPLCGSDEKDRYSVVPVPRGVFGLNWPFLLWGLRCRVVTWAAWVCDVIRCSCYEYDDFRGAGTQQGHLNPLQQHSLQASNFTLFLFVLMKKASDKGDNISYNSFVPEHFKRQYATAGSGSLSCCFLPLCLSSHMYQCSALEILTLVPEQCN